MGSVKVWGHHPSSVGFPLCPGREGPLVSRDCSPSPRVVSYCLQQVVLGEGGVPQHPGRFLAVQEGSLFITSSSEGVLRCPEESIQRSSYIVSGHPYHPGWSSSDAGRGPSVWGPLTCVWGGLPLSRVLHHLASSSVWGSSLSMRVSYHPGLLHCQGPGLLLFSGDCHHLGVHHHLLPWWT